MNKIVNNNFIDKFAEFRKNGLNQNEINQLKGAIIPSKIDSKSAEKLTDEITKDGKIDNEEQILLQVIGHSIKDTKELKKIESLIEPSNKKISDLIEKGFKNKSEILKNQKISHNPTEDLSYSKLSMKDKLSIVYDSYSNEIFKQNKERGVSGLLTNVTLTAFASKVIPAVLEKQTQKVKMMANTTLLTAGLKAGYDETDRLSKDISDAVYMIKNPKSKEDLEKAGEILAKSAFDMRDDLMVVLSGSIASNTKLPPIPKINTKLPSALKFNIVGNIPISVVGDIPLNLKHKTKIGESKTNSNISDSIVLAKKSNSISENAHIQVKPSNIKTLKEGGKGTVVKVKSIAEAEALVKKAFPNYKEVEAFGTLTEKDLNKFPLEIKSIIENRWQNNPSEKWSINKSEQELLSQWGNKNNKSKEVEGIIKEFKKRWFDSMEEFNKGETWHKDYNITDHPKLENGHGEFPHINIKKKDKSKLEIRIEK